MKTSIELSDVLYERLRAQARREHKTMRQLLEEGIEVVTQGGRRKRSRKPTLSRRFVHRSGGLTQEAARLTWGQILELTQREEKLK